MEHMILWPSHCVQGTAGAGFHRDLRTDSADLILRKDFRANIDSCSALFENDHSKATGLHGYLQGRRISRLTFAGLATDFCIRFSALDGAKLDYDVTVLLNACRAIDLDKSLAKALEEMQQCNITLTD